MCQKWFPGLVVFRSCVLLPGHDMSVLSCWTLPSSDKFRTLLHVIIHWQGFRDNISPYTCLHPVKYCRTLLTGPHDFCFYGPTFFFLLLSSCFEINQHVHTISANSARRRFYPYFAIICHFQFSLVHIMQPSGPFGAEHLLSILARLLNKKINLSHTLNLYNLKLCFIIWYIKHMLSHRLLNIFYLECSYVLLTRDQYHKVDSLSDLFDKVSVQTMFEYFKEIDLFLRSLIPQQFLKLLPMFREHGLNVCGMYPNGRLPISPWKL